MTESAILKNEILLSSADAETADNTGGNQTVDADLVRRVLAGDESAFEQIFERYKKLIAVIAAGYFQQPEQIEEVVQIVFTKAYFELENFRGAHGFSLPSWLGKITTNVCLDVLKKKSKKSENFVDDLSGEEREILFAATKDNAEKNLIGRDLTEKLLNRLPPVDRALLQMIYAEEMSVGEIAKNTGWSKSKIKVRAFRARRALRKILHKFV